MSADAAKVIGRARRSFGVSMLILIGGLVAVAGALFYRLGPAQSNAIEISQIVVPAGAEIVSLEVERRTISLVLALGDKRMIRVIDSRTGELIRDISIIEEPNSGADRAGQ
ncbi:MAG: hypothetical protein GXP01_02205 [Alphaproteobacteria bacterium]|nr:hypothetical protein [Alphaproteobacteria bacterium]